MEKETTFREVLEAAFGDKAKRLFEEDPAMAAAGATPTAAPAAGADSIKAAFRDAVMAAFDDDTLDTKATLKRIGEILKAYDKLAAKADDVAVQADAALGKATGESIEALTAKVAVLEAQAAAAKLAAKHGVTDEKAVAAIAAVPADLREELAKQLGAAAKTAAGRYEKPVSRGAGDNGAGGVQWKEDMDAKAVAAALIE
jgi:hypothetical protein